MKCPARTPASRRRPLKASLAALLLMLPVAAAGADAPGKGREPDLGEYQNLRVPPGNKVAFHAYAEGVQIYRWNGASWGFVAPEAMLFADADGLGVVGIHYAGPTWEGRGGGRVVGMVLERGTPDPAAIPWLLLGAVGNDGHGIFDRVTFIQRVNTVGGLAPAAPGTFPGEVVRVPYAADYYFYRALR